MSMQFREGAEVFAADGTKLGAVERLVIDPSRETVTHLVVAKGMFFPQERVIPVEIVGEAGLETVVLKATVELDDLPEFEESYYVTLDVDSARRSYPASASAPLIWGYPPYGAVPAMYPVYPANTVTEIVRNVPEGSRVIRAGSSVITSDGVDLGKVKEVDVSDDGDLRSFEVDPGWFQNEQTIPAHFIRTIDEDQIVLAVGADTIRQLER